MGISDDKDTHKAILVDVQQGVLLAGDVGNLQHCIVFSVICQQAQPFLIKQGDQG